MEKKIRKKFYKSSFWLFFIFACLFFEKKIAAQDAQKLSLLRENFYKAKSDSIKAVAGANLAVFWAEFQVDSTLNIAKKALFFAEKSKNYLLAAHLHERIGFTYYGRSLYDSAMTCYHQSLHLHLEKVQDEKLYPSLFNNIALVLFYLGRHSEALEFHFKAMALREKYDDKKGLAVTYNNIGSIYRQLKNFTLSLEYYEKSLKIRREIGDKKGISSALNNVGLIYENDKNYPKALQFFEEAYRIKEEIKDKNGLIILQNNISNIHMLSGNDSAALAGYLKAYENNQPLNNKVNAAYSLLGIAKAYFNLKNYAQAIAYGDKAYSLASSVGLKTLASDCAYLLFEINRDDTNFEKALFFHQKFKALTDSVFDVEKAKAIEHLESKMRLEKREKEILLLEKDKKLSLLEAENKQRQLLITLRQSEAERLGFLASNEKNKRLADSLAAASEQAAMEAKNLKIIQEKINAENKAANLEIEKNKQEKEGHIIINFLVLCVLFLSFAAIGILWYYMKKNAKINAILDLQNKDIQAQNALIEETYEELKYTSEIVEQNIAYSSKIQQTILPNDADLSAFFSQHWQIYMPKNKVSGDFYWFSQIDSETAVLALGDCTGHGVSGAFMTMLACTLLHECVNVRKIHSPADVLWEIRTGIFELLKQGKSRNRDGMDISLCFFEKNRHEQKILFRFAGAKTSVYYLSENKIFEVKGNRQYIGGQKRNEKPFDNHELLLPLPTQFYLFTDGLIDQNNPENLKLGSVKFKEFIAEICLTDFLEQKEKILTLFRQFRAGEEQRDDVSVLSVRFENF